ncbi:MAG: hypothetical protein AAF702_09940 [Chloroflexota bacterium]
MQLSVGIIFSTPPIGASGLVGAIIPYDSDRYSPAELFGTRYCTPCFGRDIGCWIARN